MASISSVIFVTFFLAGYFTKHNGGIPIPINEPCVNDGNSLCWRKIDLWRCLVGSGEADTAPNLLIKNMSIWFLVYTFAHILTHVEPQRNLFKPFKFNPNYPPLSLVIMEMARSARGVLIATFYEFVINDQHAKNNLPLLELPEMFQSSKQSNDTEYLDLSLLGVFVLTFFNYFWGDFHFYWTHRMLHTKWLYRNVHKVHHESFNPDPFSGLSMHWLESSIYFSAAPLISFLLPLWAYRFHTFGLLIFPLGGHCGFGSWERKTHYSHYVHHSKFNWNYGSSPLWDHLMGTEYKSEASFSARKSKNGDILHDEQRRIEAEVQACLVGASIGEDMRSISTSNRTKTE